MDFKDVITPLVTLAGVWLAARFTLRNEVQKKHWKSAPRGLKALPPTAAIR